MPLQNAYRHCVTQVECRRLHAGIACGSSGDLHVLVLEREARRLCGPVHQTLSRGPVSVLNFLGKISPERKQMEQEKKWINKFTTTDK
jgi:hypothetical protein